MGTGMPLYPINSGYLLSEFLTHVLSELRKHLKTKIRTNDHQIRGGGGAFLCMFAMQCARSTYNKSKSVALVFEAVTMRDAMNHSRVNLTYKMSD